MECADSRIIAAALTVAAVFTVHHVLGAGAAAAAEPDPAGALYALTVAKALPGERDLQVYLETSGGRIVAAVADAPTFSKAPFEVDAAKLAVAGGALRGPLAVTTVSDGYNPPIGQTLRAVYAIDAKVDGAKVAGTYAGRCGVAADGKGGMPTKGAITGTVAAPPSPAGAVRLSLDMVNAAGDKGIDRGVWGRRGFVYIAFRDGKCIQAIIHGHGDARQINYFEAVVTATHLVFDAGRLTGTVAARSTQGQVYVYNLDGRRAGPAVGGAFTKTVDGKEAPGGVFVGRLEAVGDTSADNAVYNIELLGAVAGGRQLNCFIPRRSGAFSRGMGYSGSWNHTYHDVDPAGLALAGGALSGELKVTMNPDPYVPPDRKPVPAAYTIDARVRDGCVIGSFKGRFKDAGVSGAVVGRLAALPPVPEPVRYYIKLDDGVNGGAPWFRRVYLGFVAAKGQADQGGMSNNKGGWTGTFKNASVQFDGTAFQATIECSIDTSHTAVTGRYTFKLTGRAVGNEIIGTVETWRDGVKTKQGTAFMGGFGPAE